MEFRRRLTPRRNDELSGHDDEIVVSINSMSRVDSNSGRENAVDWFEQIMPELLSYDSMLYRTLIGEVGI
jgi:hypothetical protein